jgi:hypothetical protein
MFTEVTDVGMKPKSTIFGQVNTAFAEEKAVDGRIWRSSFGSAVSISTCSHRSTLWQLRGECKMGRS